MKISKYILLFLFFIFCFTDCKKYPEGPLVSFTSKVKRVLGDYEVEAFLVDGADSTSQLTCLKYRFYRDQNKQLLNSPECSGGSTGNGGDWNFENHHKNLHIYFSISIGSIAKTPFPNTGSLSSDSELSWEIQKLTQSQKLHFISDPGVFSYDGKREKRKPTELYSPPQMHVPKPDKTQLEKDGILVVVTGIKGLAE